MRPSGATSIKRVISCFLTLAAVATALGAQAQTFTTVADGDWSSAATWSGGSVPDPGLTGNFPSTFDINIRHTVNWNSSNSINNDGIVRIEPIVGTTARLNLPTNVNVNNFGEWYVINAEMIQFRFVGGGNSGTEQSGSFKNTGGLVDVQGSTVEIAQDWTNESGAERFFVDSCLFTGQNFSNSDSLDVLIRSSVSIGWHTSGSFQYANTQFQFDEVRVQLAGTSGNFELNSGLAFGDIDYITLKNHVTGNVGSGKISASSSLDTSPGLNLDAFCAATYEPNGKFSGTQTSEPRPACPLTDTFFPCAVGTPDEPQLTLIKTVVNDNGGNAARPDFDLNLQGNDGVHNAGVDYQDAGSGVQPTVVAGVEYTVSEIPLGGYNLDSIVCTDDDTQADVGTTFTLADGQNVTCVFTNNDVAPTITLIKNVINDDGGNAGPDDFGISVGGMVVASGATTPVMANTPIAIDEAGLPGYMFTSITGDPECPASLGGTVTLDEGENITCTITNNDVATELNLIKTIESGPILNLDGTYTVAYRITATNGGQSAGSYDLTDTLTPAPGITLDSAELTSYNPGTENDQSGTLFASPLPQPFVNGSLLVDDEGLAAGLDESWTITAVFSVDPTLLTGEEDDCVQGQEVIGAGFYNFVDGNIDEDESDNDACVNLPDPAINLVKSVDSGPVLNMDGSYTVVYTVTATNSGNGPGAYDLVDTFTPAPGITLDSAELTSYNPGSENDQSGTLFASPLPQVFANGTMIVDDEFLAGQRDESWTITAVFSVDPTLLTGEEDDCVQGKEVIGTGFYNFVDGNIDEDESDNDACVNLPNPAINLVKSVDSGPVLNMDGSYTVVYTVTADNMGNGPGAYDLVDTFTPAPGITLDSAELTSYNPGSENDQSGTLFASPLPQVFANGTLIVDDEFLAGQRDESWTITAVFSVDPPSITADAQGCVQGQEVQGMGFYNFVDGNIDEDETDNDACVNLPDPAINLVKSVDSGPVLNMDGTYTVAYTVTATNSGDGPGNYDLVDTFTPAPGITLASAELTSYNPGSENDQSGTLVVGSPLPQPFSNGDTLVTGEALGVGLDESWTITAVFSIDPTQFTGDETGCVQGEEESGTGFYNFVDGNIDEDESDNDACVNLPAPDINLVKTVDSGPVLNMDGSYTVVYEVTATNSGDGPGAYDLVDTFTPAPGITLASAELTSYNPGTENDQSGTLFASPLPQVFANGTLIVDDEFLAGQRDESWTITAVFSVDPPSITGDAQGCVQGQEVAGMGFYNFVDGNIDEDESDNDACVNLPDPAINLAKEVFSFTNNGDGSYTVVYTVGAENTGEGPGFYDLIDTFDPGNGITLMSAELTSYIAGTENNQSGTLVVGSPLPQPFNSGDTLVTGEALAAARTEFWRITAVFDVDPAEIDETADCDPANAAGTGFYNLVEGNIEEDLTDNDACVSLEQADIQVEKSASSPVQNPDGTFSVTYTIFVQNVGEGSGVYNLDDTLLNDVSLTLVAIDQGLTYNAGASNDPTVPPQDGTIEPVAVGDLQGGTTTLLTGETLAGLSDETWTIILRFELDAGLVTPTGSDCVLQAGENGTGFLNRVHVVVGGVIVDEDDGCTEIPMGELARFRVIKDFSDDNPMGVEVFIECNTGLPLEQSKVITEGEDNGVNFVVGDFDDGQLECDVFEEPLEGYSTTYTASGDSDFSDDAEGCHYTNVTGGDQNRCDVFNELDPVIIVVEKLWIGEFEEHSIPTFASAQYTCFNTRPDPFGPTGTQVGFLFFSGDSSDESANLYPDFDGSSFCAVTELDVDSPVESDVSDCQNMPIAPGMGNSCTIINTLFLQGIPTLSQYGLILLALLMLGVGVFAYRRYA